MYWGAGIICGNGTQYARHILDRDDAAALERDMQAIGNDIWTAIGTAHKSLDNDSQKEILREQRVAA